MEIVIEKDLLKNTLVLASRFSSSKLSSTPILQGALIIADKNTVTISTTNLNDYFTSTIKCRVIKPGKTIIDLKSLTEYLNLCDDVEITLKTDQNTISITKDKTKINFPIYQSEDFPQLDIKKGKTINLTKKEMDQINSILFSTSKDSSRPTLTGIHFCFKNNQNYIITTDGFRLSIIKSTTKNNYPTITITPSLFQETTTNLGYSEIDNAVTTTHDTTIITSRVIAGDYPPFEKVIPNETKTTITINRQEFLKNIKIAAIFIKKTSNTIVLDIKKDGLYIRPKNEKDSGSIIHQPLVDFDGEPIKIAFNYKFITDFLSNNNSKNIIIQTLSSTSPCIFRNEGDDGFIHIIMPLRIEEL